MRSPLANYPVVRFPDGIERVRTFALFVRAGGRLGDADLIAQLGIGACESLDRLDCSPPELGRDSGGRVPFFIAHDAAGWTHVWDGSYHLFHHLMTPGPLVTAPGFLGGLPSARYDVDALCSEHDVFLYRTGDADDGFEYHLFQNGKLRRRYVVLDMSWGKTPGRVLEDEGEPIDAEPGGVDYDFATQKLPETLRALGIVTDYERVPIRGYTRPQNPANLFASLRSWESTAP